MLQDSSSRICPLQVHLHGNGDWGGKFLGDCDIYRMTPVRFGSVPVWGWNGSSGSGFRFRRFLCKKGFSVFQYSLTGKDGSGSGFGSWKTVPAVPVPLSVSGKNGSDGSGFRFRFGSWATLYIYIHTFLYVTYMARKKRVRGESEKRDTESRGAGGECHAF